MKTNKQELKDFGACEPGYKRFLKQTHNVDGDVDVASLVGGLNNYEDLLWLAYKRLPAKRVRQFACDCALLNAELLKPYVDKDTYDLIVDWLHSPTSDISDIEDAVAVARMISDIEDKYAVSAVSYALFAVSYAYDDAAFLAAYSAANRIVFTNSGDANKILKDGECYHTTSSNYEQVNELLINMFNEVA